jgi:hypothetical protein
MNRPKYTENPMAFLREVVAHGTQARLGKLQDAVDKARKALKDAEDELAYAVHTCKDDGHIYDLDLQGSLCLWDSEAWTATLAGMDKHDSLRPDGDRRLYWSLMCHHADREILDLNRLGLIFPDYCPRAGVRDGLERFKAGRPAEERGLA